MPDKIWRSGGFKSWVVDVASNDGVWVQSFDFYNFWVKTTSWLDWYLGLTIENYMEVEMKRILFQIFALAVFLIATSAQAAILYDQDFENPAAFNNDGGDVNIYNSVNTLYGNQPSGFTFAQAHTVETLLITGDQAFGHGYSDPSATGGNYALGMLSSGEDDQLGLSFNVGDNDFLNLSLDVSSIDLNVFGGPFVTPGDIPVYEFTLFDNPSGSTTLGDGTVLSSMQVSGTASDQDVFDWTRVMLALDADGNTNGNVTLRIDLLEGGYAAMDNFLIEASNTPVPIPGAVWLLGSGIAGLVGVKTRKKRS